MIPYILTIILTVLLVSGLYEPKLFSNMKYLQIEINQPSAWGGFQSGTESDFKEYSQGHNCMKIVN